MNAGIIDSPGEFSLIKHLRRKARISKILITEAAAGLTNKDPALFQRGPRQKLALRIGHRGVALIGPHIAKRCAKLTPPANGVTGAAGRAKIVSHRDFRTEFCHQLPVRGKAVCRQ